MNHQAGHGFNWPCSCLFKTKKIQIMARFKPGESGNPNGRPPGSSNKVHKPLKQEIQAFLSEQWQQIQHDFDALEPVQRIQMFERLLRFVLPQPRETDMRIDFTKLDESELNLIIDKMLDSYAK